MFALADLGTGVCVLENDKSRTGGPDWADAVATATSRTAVAAELARLVAAVRPVTEDEVRELLPGALPLAPGDGRAGVAGGGRRRTAAHAAWRLTGPGIAGEATLSPRGLPPGFVAARAEAVAGYPAGIESFW